MPLETDSSLDKGIKDKEEGKNLYSMTEKKINRVDYIKLTRRHPGCLLACGPEVRDQTWSVCVCVVGGCTDGSVEVSHALGVLGSILRILIPACLLLGQFYPEGKQIIGGKPARPTQYDLGGDTDSAHPEVFSFLGEIPSLRDKALSPHMHILQPSTEYKLCADPVLHMFRVLS